jgi:hypothetical protein
VGAIRIRFSKLRPPYNTSFRSSLLLSLSSLQELLLPGAVLVVHEGLLDRDGNHVEDICRLLEDEVHLFERPVSGLREEEVDGGEDEGVDHSEDDVGSVPNRLKCDRGDHDNHEVEDPVARGGEGVGRGADLEGDDFGGVSAICVSVVVNRNIVRTEWDKQPSHSQPSDGEECIEDEEEDGLCDAGRGVDVVRVQGDVVVRDCKSSHRQSHACRTEEHERTAANLLDDEDGDERCHEVLRAVACSKKLGVVVLSETDTCVERGGVVSVFIVSAYSRELSERASYVIKLMPDICWYIWLT